MTAARLMQIQREMGLRPLKTPTKAGRPGSFAPRVVTAHWTAARSSAARPAPSENIVRNGHGGLPGPLYGDLIPYQTDMNDLQVIPITIGRSNNSGIGHLSIVNAARAGRTSQRRARTAGSHGLNGVTDAVSADYTPGQGPPPAAMVEALTRAVAARVIYRGLPAHATTDHAQQTSRKIDLLQHWWPDGSSFEAYRRRVADLVQGEPAPEPDPEDEDMRLTHGDEGTNVQRVQQELNTWRNRQGLSLLSENGVYGTTMVECVKEFQAHVGYPQDGEVDYWTHQRLRDLNMFARLDALEA